MAAILEFGEIFKKYICKFSIIFFLSGSLFFTLLVSAAPPGAGGYSFESGPKPPYSFEAGLRPDYTFEAESRPDYSFVAGTPEVTTTSEVTTTPEGTTTPEVAINKVPQDIEQKFEWNDVIVELPIDSSAKLLPFGDTINYPWICLISVIIMALFSYTVALII